MFYFKPLFLINQLNLDVKDGEIAQNTHRKLSSTFFKKKLIQCNFYFNPHLRRICLLIWERNINQLPHICSHPDLGSNLQLRYTPWPGIEIHSLLAYGMTLQASHLAKAFFFLKKIPIYWVITQLYTHTKSQTQIHIHTQILFCICPHVGYVLQHMEKKSVHLLISMSQENI